MNLWLVRAHTNMGRLTNGPLTLSSSHSTSWRSWPNPLSTLVRPCYLRSGSPTLIFPFSLCLVTCVIMQKNGAGLHTASSCFWDNTTDGSCTVRWENKTMYVIVSVFGLSIWTTQSTIANLLFTTPALVLGFTSFIILFSHSNINSLDNSLSLFEHPTIPITYRLWIVANTNHWNYQRFNLILIEIINKSTFAKFINLLKFIN